MEAFALVKMIADDMIHGALPPLRRRRIRKDTPIVPRAVAEAVWEEACVWLHTELPRAWVRQLAVKAELTYSRNGAFQKRLQQQGDAGRDWLWAFTRHWLAAMIRKHRQDLHSRLPAEYNIGANLPLGAAPRRMPIPPPAL